MFEYTGVGVRACVRIMQNARNKQKECRHHYHEHISTYKNGFERVKVIASSAPDLRTNVFSMIRIECNVIVRYYKHNDCCMS